MLSNLQKAGRGKARKSFAFQHNSRREKMALVIQTNNAAVTAQKNINTNVMNQNKALNRLSSGFRINSAADDAAGFAISSKLDAQGARLKAAALNATQATALVKTAEAGVNEIQNMVVRLQTLAVQASSANNAGSLTQLDAERSKLTAEIDKIANSTNFNGTNLLNGIDANSAGTAGVAFVKATAGTVTQGGGSTTNAQITITGNATFSDAATFTVQYNSSGKVTSVKANAILHDSTGNALNASTTTELLSSADVTTPKSAPTALGLTFTAAAASGTGVSGSATFTTSGGTNYVAAVTAGTGDYSGALSFQVGADNNSDNQVDVNLQHKYTLAGLGISGDISTSSNAKAYVDTLKTALDTLITQRADLGASANQLGFVSANLATSIEQVSASVSSIRDADIATEMANFSKSQILVQAGTAMLAQANQSSQNVLRLFR